jgi:hypothetical protein
MLAYVFWHWPQPHIDRAEYVEHLVDFQRTLAANKSAGFRESMVYRIRGANWLKTDGEAYEEWYLLDDSAAMDRLNEAAVSGACEEPHNRVAREAADGTGGLYRLRAGQLAEARFATWLSKPSGVSYRDFYETITGVTLWQRQMTLGPTTEFCIHSSTPLDQSSPLELIWPRI